VRVLGIDPGTNCGWALLETNMPGAPFAGPIHRASGVWGLKGGRHEGGGMRFVRLRKYLRDLLDAMPVDAVAYEEVRRHMGTDAAHIYGGVVATLTEVCEERSLPYTGIPVGTVKRRATGKGGADKAAMIAAARAAWPLACVDDDNHADALWIAASALYELETA
jgi:crossover junction endodeoxyribonuclease RuvC